MHIDQKFMFVMIIVIIYAITWLILIIVNFSFDMPSAITIIVAHAQSILAIIIWQGYTSAQNTRKKYQIRQVCETLKNILEDSNKLYKLKHDEKNFEKIKSKQISLKNNISILQYQIRVTGSIFNITQIKRLKIIDKFLSNEYADVENISQKRFHTNLQSSFLSIKSLFDMLDYEIKEDLFGRL